jgi:hypothetical protein
MKTLTIDESKWRCGSDGKVGCALGKGRTLLLNVDGYMCCLGQILLQLGATKDQIKWLTNPCDINMVIPPLTVEINSEIVDTELAKNAMGINDDKFTTVTEKKKKLTKLFRSKGYRLIFK